MRLQLDADIHGGLAQALRKRGIDAVNAAETGRLEISDEEQLAKAVADGRCLMTFNVKDFVLLHNDYSRTGREHFGVVVSKQVTLSVALRRILALLQTTAAEDVYCQLRFL